LRPLSGLAPAVPHALAELHLRRLPAPRPELHDPRISAGAPLKPLRQIEEHLLDQIDLLGLTRFQPRSEARNESADQALRVKTPGLVGGFQLFVLAVGDLTEPNGLAEQPLGHTPELLGFG